MSAEQDYADGLADGLAGRDPDPSRIAYGADRLNAYERGYIDSGQAEEHSGVFSALGDEICHPYEEG